MLFWKVGSRTEAMQVFRGSLRSSSVVDITYALQWDRGDAAGISATDQQVKRVIGDGVEAR